MVEKFEVDLSQLIINEENLDQLAKFSNSITIDDF